MCPNISFSNRINSADIYKGFRMLVGNPFLRENTNTMDLQQSSFRCFDANFGGVNAPPGGGSDTRSFPTKPCAGGIRTNLFFPT